MAKEGKPCTTGKEEKEKGGGTSAAKGKQWVVVVGDSLPQVTEASILLPKMLAWDMCYLPRTHSSQGVTA